MKSKTQFLFYAASNTGEKEEEKEMLLQENVGEAKIDQTSRPPKALLLFPPTSRRTNQHIPWSL